VSCVASIRARFTAPGAAPFELEVEVGLERGETLVVLGPSGSGKTLLLESIAGFHAHGGYVHVHDDDVTRWPPDARGLGYVFQDYALFPHLTVEENVRFGIHYRHSDVDVDALLRRLGVAHLRRRYPPTLSGGEQQRVALARALAVRPRLLLLDEPLASLDRPAKEALRHDLRALLEGVSAILVTHDRDEARMLGDRLAVVRDGHLVQTGTVDAVFDTPADEFVAAFLGYARLPATVLPAGGSNGAAVLCLRPEAISIVADDAGRVAARVHHVVREGAQYRVSLDVDDVAIDVVAAQAPAPGERVGLTWSDADGHWLNERA